MMVARMKLTPYRTISTAATAPMKPATEPTDRSMCPVTMTSSMPSAMMTM
jgi:hypothetical protein